jgi:hypothetical protein
MKIAMSTNKIGEQCVARSIDQSFVSTETYVARTKQLEIDTRDCCSRVPDGCWHTEH